MAKRIEVFGFSVTEKEYEEMIEEIKEEWEIWKDCYDSYEEFEEDRLHLMCYPE